MKILSVIKKNELIKNTGIIAIGKISTQIVSFFLLPVYTAYLTAADYGVVDLLNTLIQLLLPIVSLQLEQAIFRFLIEYRNNEEKQKEYISSTIVFLAITGISYTVFMVIVGGFIQNKYKYFLLFNLLTVMFSYVLSQIARGLGHNGIYSVANFLMSLVNIVLNIVFIVTMGMGALGMLLSGLISNVVSCIYVIVAIRLDRYISVKAFKLELCKKMTKYSFPLIPNQISWWVFNASDRLIISAILSVSLNGIYAVANKFSTLFVTVFNYFALSWTEQAAIHINDENASAYFSKVSETSIRFFSTLILGMIAVMPFVFPYIVNAQYENAYYQIPILLLGAYFNIIVGIYSAVYIAKKDTKSIAKTSFLAALINVIINIMFISKWRLFAASISTVIAYAFLAIYRIIDARKYIKIQINKICYISFFMMYILIFVTYMINNVKLNIIALLIACVYALIINRKTIVLALERKLRE
ncbi:MAG: oligosaccharide flippase family protein [Lachnospiraceae bacterium]|nr:oligosaccharide flippase family protein [Lachnospiraceae bacterium]